MTEAIRLREVLLLDVRRVFELCAIAPDVCPPYDLPAVLVDLMLALADVPAVETPTDIDCPPGRPIPEQWLPPGVDLQ